MISAQRTPRSKFRRFVPKADGGAGPPPSPDATYDALCSASKETSGVSRAARPALLTAPFGRDAMSWPSPDPTPV
jgi:hypothetical protein